MIGKYVIVRSNVAGVHAGLVEQYEFGKSAVVLKNAYRLWRVFTRDKSGSISDVAANGLMPGKEHQIGARLATVAIENPQGLEIAEMTEEAYKSLAEWVKDG